MTKMITKAQVLALAQELEEEEKKVTYVPHYYKRNSKMIRRQDDDIVYTPRYEELLHFLWDEEKTKIFKCHYCKKTVSYGDLESDACSFDNDLYICSICYVDRMGEDL